MNWYKLAELALNITPDQFQAMTYEGKLALARNPSLTPVLQLLFFTEEYEGKDNILWPLAENTSISPQAQLLFFRPEYNNSNSNILWGLAENTSISPQAQLLFFTQEYRSKENILYTLRHSPSFLKNLTSGQWLQIKNAARGEMRLHVLKKRLEQIAGAS